MNADLGSHCYIDECAAQPSHWAEVTPQGSVPHTRVALCANHTFEDVTAITADPRFTERDIY